MKKSAHPEKKDSHPKVKFRDQKAILEADLRLQSLPNDVSPDEYLAEITDLIQRFPCTKDEKRTLLDLYTGAWPTDADLKAIEDRAREKLQDGVPRMDVKKTPLSDVPLFCQEFFLSLEFLNSEVLAEVLLSDR